MGDTRQQPERASRGRKAPPIVDLKSICGCCDYGQGYETVEEGHEGEGGEPLFNCDPPYKVLFFADSPQASNLNVEKEVESLERKFKEGASKAQNQEWRRVAKDNVMFVAKVHRKITDLPDLMDEVDPVILHLSWPVQHYLLS